MPGFVFAVIVLLPISRWAGDGWPRTAGAVVASSAIYPLAHLIAANSVIDHSPAFIIVAVAFSGFIGSSALASTFLFGRPHCVKPAITTILLGAAIGALSGAFLLVPWPLFGSSMNFRLGVILVVWQTVVGASLGRGALAPHNQAIEDATPSHDPVDVPVGGPASAPLGPPSPSDHASV